MRLFATFVVDEDAIFTAPEKVPNIGPGGVLVYGKVDPSCQLPDVINGMMKVGVDDDKFDVIYLVSL